ncbi:MAG: hypothetical protein KDA61_03140, partial [Planctomycetales bacterium]|nr:hypothetical protein [Planctomycetales bacterium]
HGEAARAIPTLLHALTSPEPRLVLQAARSVYFLGEAAQPAAEQLENARRSLESTEPGNRRYRDFNYSSFAGWALEAALINCHAAAENDFE